jgi:hypothetical protein
VNLQVQLDHLEIAFLSRIETEFPDPLSEIEVAHVRAYLVLAHAILEEYVEKQFELHFDRLVTELQNETVARECVLFAYSVSENLPVRLRLAYKKRDVIQLLKKPARDEFLRILEQNNGLKTENIQNLASFIGLDWTEFDDAFNSELADLNTLGVKRGSAGHLSPYTSKVTSIAQNSGPDDVRSWVNAGRDAVLKLELYLSDRIK